MNKEILEEEMNFWEIKNEKFTIKLYHTFNLLEGDY